MASDDTARVQDALQNVNLSDVLDETRRTSISTALRDYRDTVLQHNLAMFRILVTGMAEQEDECVDEDEIEELRLVPFSEEYLGAYELPESVEVVQDLLSDAILPELIVDYELDGVDSEPVNVPSRNNWFSEVRASVASKAPSVTEFPPADLHYLCTLVSAIGGTGLPYYRRSEQIAFISDLESRSKPVLTRQQLDAYEPLWADWEIAIACKLGQGLRSHSGSVTLFCRRPSLGLEWQWRYGMYDEGWCSSVYNTVEEFLAWYAHHSEQTSEEVKKDIRSLEPPAN